MSEDEARLIGMTQDEFDRYMCETYPLIFQDRRKPMTVTCMIWGFCIGPGWRPLLDRMCAKLRLVGEAFGMTCVAEQVKEKLGILRFYKRTQLAGDGDPESYSDAEVARRDVIDCIVDDIVDKAERDSDHTCDVCGEYFHHDKLVDGSWIMGCCEKCFVLSDNPEIAAAQVHKLELIRKRRAGKKALAIALSKLQARMPDEAILDLLKNAPKE